MFSLLLEKHKVQKRGGTFLLNIWTSVSLNHQGKRKKVSYGASISRDPSPSMDQLNQKTEPVLRFRSSLQ